MHSDTAGGEETEKHVDICIIGGGPAGMSAALVAGRSLLDTVVINAEAPRNDATGVSHGFITRDGTSPMELLDAGKDDLAKYDTVSYRRGTVTGCRTAETGVALELANGNRLTADRVVIAVGRRDNLSDLELPGIENVYGESVYPCPFCDGYEHRSEKVAVFGGADVEQFAGLLQNWSPDIMAFTNGTTLDETVQSRMERRGVDVETDPVANLRSNDGQLEAIELETGARIERECGFISTDCSVPATDFQEQLGVETTTNEWGKTVYDTDEHGQTSNPAVYAIGDARTGFSGVVNAASEGYKCMVQIVHEVAGASFES